MATNPSADARASLRDTLSGLRMPDSSAPRFDPGDAPARPFELFADWLEVAVAGAVAAPHAMVLATTSTHGGPAARTVLLQDVTTDGTDLSLRFASSSDSPKGRDLASDSRAAVVLHWKEQHRQIRVTGTVRPAERQVSEEDFAGRSPTSRAGIVTARQSEPMPDETEAAKLLAEAQDLLAGNPRFVPPTWTVYFLDAESVEFWQGQPREQQQRLRYERETWASGGGDADGWRRDRLWP